MATINTIISELISTYRISNNGNGVLCVHGSPSKEVIAEIRAHKQEIMDYLHEEAEAKLKAEKERNDKIAAIEGLDALQRAISDCERYGYEFRRMMEDEYNDGARPPRKPSVSIAELKAIYPRAAAYIEAKEWSYASNYIKSAAGRVAVEKIINGYDYNETLANMKKEWSDYCTNRALG